MPVDLNALTSNLVNQLLDPVFVVDEEGRIVFVSEACESLLGYTPGEMVGTPIRQYIHPDDLERTLAAAHRVMKGQPHTDFENRYRHKNGSVVHILWSARWSEDNRLRIAVARDVTALRQSNQTRDALYRIADAALRADTLRALCDGVHQVIEELFPDDALFLTFFDATTGQLSTPSVNDARALGWRDESLPAGTALAEVIDTGQILVASFNPDQPGMGLLAPGDPTQSSNWLGVPLMAHDRVLGALTIESEYRYTGYREADKDLLQFVATQVAIAVERKRAEEHLRFLAHHDPLTGLTNRALFYDRLETALRQANRSGGHLAVLYLDLNNFKHINDSLGHAAGDQLLIDVANRLRWGTRDADTVTRMGGDEFTLLLSDVMNRADLESAVRKIRRLMAAPFTVNGAALTVTCSVGGALYPENGNTAQQLLSSADAHMYTTKRKR